MAATRRGCLALAVGCLALAAHPGVADGESSDPAALRQLLLRHHEAPSVESIRRVAGDPVAALTALAADRTETVLVRRRATTMLGRLPGAPSVGALTALLRGSDQGRVRRAAARALARLLDSRPAELVPLLGGLLDSAEPDDRETAVWLLAEVDTARAHALLSRRRIIERHRTVVDALRRVRR